MVRGILQKVFASLRADTPKVSSYDKRKDKAYFDFRCAFFMVIQVLVLIGAMLSQSSMRCHLVEIVSVIY